MALPVSTSPANNVSIPSLRMARRKSASCLALSTNVVRNSLVSVMGSTPVASASCSPPSKTWRLLYPQPVAFSIPLRAGLSTLRHPSRNKSGSRGRNRFCTQRCRCPLPGLWKNFPAPSDKGRPQLWRQLWHPAFRTTMQRGSFLLRPDIPGWLSS